MSNVVLFAPKRPKLYDSQKVLYALLVGAVEKQEAITEKSLVAAYLTCHSDMMLAIKWDEEKKCCRHESVKATDWCLVNRAKAWLNSGIGALVVKGYLTVIPKFDLKEIDDKAILAPSLAQAV